MSFTQYYLDFDKDIYKILSETSVFDDIIKGRKGAILLDNRNELVPIVRTTSSYTSPAQSFKEIHCEIINKIKETLNPNFKARIDLRGYSKKDKIDEIIKEYEKIK